MRLQSFKILSALLTLVIAWGGVLLPMALRGNETFLSLSRMLAVGVMLGGGLLHLLPDAAAEIADAFEFPVAYFLFSMGLILPLAVETLMLSPHANDHGMQVIIHAKDISDDISGSEDSIGPARRELPLSTAMVLLVALSFHSVLEGLAQGTARTIETGMVLLLAIAAHKGLAAFALGCLFLDARLSCDCRC